jgi:two-component system phosphate regulon sensor histidine kinase PhoR
MSLLDKLTHAKPTPARIVPSPLTEASAPQAPQGSETSLIGLTSRFLFEEGEVAIAVVDIEGKIVLTNTYFDTMTGWSKSLSIGLGQEIIITIQDESKQSMMPHIIEQLRNSSSPLRLTELSLLSKTKSLFRVDVVVHPLVAKGGAIQGYLWQIYNLNANRKVERMQDEFVSTVSHELRTPMTAIEGYLSLMLNDKSLKIDPKLYGYLNKAHAASRGMAQVLQQLLTITNIDQGTISGVVKKLIDLEPIILKTIGAFSSESEISHLPLTFSKGDVGTNVIMHIPAVYGDAKRIEEILVNVVSNAFKFTDKGEITISVETDPQYVTIVVKDTGCGIPAESLPHVFERFYQVDARLNKAKNGLGVGLFVTKSLIESLDGSIELTSDVGRGTNVYLHFPRA